MRLPLYFLLVKKIVLFSLGCLTQQMLMILEASSFYFVMNVMKSNVTVTFISYLWTHKF
jgi:hypothetical protein